MIIITILAILAGMPFGYLLRKNKTMQQYVGHGLNMSVWGLLFLLGVGLGVDDNLMSQIDSLGLQAITISFFAVFGSLLGAVFLGHYVFKDSFVKNSFAKNTFVKNTTEQKNIQTKNDGHEQNHNQNMLYAPSGTVNNNYNEVGNKDANDSEKVSKMSAIRDSLIVLGFFSGGIILGAYPIIPLEWALGETAAIALFILLFLAGVSVGFDIKAFGIFREMKGKVLLVPITTTLGTLALSPLACLIFPELRIIDAMVVASGLGYYSVSSTMITQVLNPVLGSVALLANMSREILTLILTPLLLRYFGRLGPVVAGGATSNDSSLPIIAKYCGERYAIIAIFSGVLLTLTVPLLVSALLHFA